MKDEKNCPCCPNHCDVNSLSCGRGREYFKTSSDKTPINNKTHHFKQDEESMNLEEKALFKIRRCGHYLHHSEKNVDLTFLSDNEKENLIAILSKCLDNWK